MSIPQHDTQSELHSNDHCRDNLHNSHTINGFRISKSGSRGLLTQGREASTQNLEQVFINQFPLTPGDYMVYNICNIVTGRRVELIEHRF